MIKMSQYVSDNVTLALGRLAQNNLSIKNSMALARFIKKQNEEHTLAVKAYERYSKQKQEGCEKADQEWRDLINSDIEIDKLPADILDQVEKMSAADIIYLEPLISDPHKQ
jgi:hypothetical protein